MVKYLPKSDLDGRKNKHSLVRYQSELFSWLGLVFLFARRGLRNEHVVVYNELNSAPTAIPQLYTMTTMYLGPHSNPSPFNAELPDLTWKMLRSYYYYCGDPAF